LKTIAVEKVEKVRPCDINKLVNALKLRKACVLDGIPNEYLWHLPRRPMAHVTFISSLPLAVLFSKALEGSKSYVTETQ
jgi:hypothetical protein